MATGEIEVRITHAEILGPAKILPFPIADDAAVSEATRLQYRFLISVDRHCTLIWFFGHKSFPLFERK